MRIRSENSLCRLWDFERPRPQIPIPRHRKDFVVVCCCVYRESGRGGARAPRQHKRVITTAGDHDIMHHNHNKNIPCGL